MYAVGAEHPLKGPCGRILILIAEHPSMFITDAEVLQELIHRYLAQRRWADGQAVFRRFAVLMRDRVESIRGSDVEQAAALADSYPELAPRDLLHAAVMQRLGVQQITSADAGFDHIAGIDRLDPGMLPVWEASVRAVAG